MAAAPAPLPLPPPPLAAARRRPRSSADRADRSGAHHDVVAIGAAWRGARADSRGVGCGGGWGWWGEEDWNRGMGEEQMDGWVGGFARSVAEEAGNESFSPFLTPFFTLFFSYTFFLSCVSVNKLGKYTALTGRGGLSGIGFGVLSGFKLEDGVVEKRLSEMKVVVECGGGVDSVRWRQRPLSRLGFQGWTVVVISSNESSYRRFGEGGGSTAGGWRAVGWPTGEVSGADVVSSGGDEGSWRRWKLDEGVKRRKKLPPQGHMLPLSCNPSHNRGS
jgi:hypothetical protein